jgi:hypothetical protein
MAIVWRSAVVSRFELNCPHSRKFSLENCRTDHPAAAADAESMCIMTVKYHPSITTQGSSGRLTAFGSTSTLAERCNNPLVLNLINVQPNSSWNSKLVCQKFVVARSFRPAQSSRVPPLLHVLFLKVAMSTSESQPRTVALVCQNPMRLKVQQPSSLSPVANDPKELRKRKVAASSSAARNS